MIKLRFLFICLFSLSIQVINAQIFKIKPKDPTKEQRRFLDDFYVGSNFNLSIGFNNINQSTIDVSPFIGYKITKDVSFGICGVYNFYSISNGIQRQSINVFGGRAFARVKVITKFFLQGEAESVFLTSKSLAGKLRADHYFAGIGINNASEDQLGPFVVLLYNFKPSEITPNFLIFRVGFHIGF